MRARLSILLAALLALAPGAASSRIAVLGVPHFRSLQPAPSAEHRERLVAAAARFAPTLVCIEAVPGQKVDHFAEAPDAYGELLQTFAPDALRLGPEQQVRLRLSPVEARAEALVLARQETLDGAGQLRLIALQLAAYDPWSAALNWTRLDQEQRRAARGLLGDASADRLAALAQSTNEIAAFAIPLARRLGHRRLCAADPFEDELAVQPLEPDLAAVISSPSVAAGVGRFEEEVRRRWRPDDPDGLLTLVRWHNGEAYARLSEAVQWSLFDRDSPGDAARRRLMLWHARNAEIQAWLFRALAEPGAGRLLFVVGASHRPFLAAALRAQPWIRLEEDPLGR